jgi:hypothetical protein
LPHLDASDRSALCRQTAFIRLCYARLAGTSANQMLMVAMGCLRLFPALAKRDRLISMPP